MSFLSPGTLTSDLIRIPSLSGDEKNVTTFLKSLYSTLGWTVETLPIASQRENLLVAFGTPQIVLTTHTDIVPAPSHLFEPKIEGNFVKGRGACDAKGSLASMICAAQRLRAEGVENFGLLFVVGEEDDGIGAQTAAQQLKGRGVRYLINGEPTEGTLAIGQKGVLEFILNVEGKACHSGYPELGIDANLKLLKLLTRIHETDFGADPDLGRSSVNFGLINGGVSANVISPHASARVLIRLSIPSTEVLKKLDMVIGTDANYEVVYRSEAMRMETIPGFESRVVAYGSDLPHYAPLGAKSLQYGPGSIHNAHTDHEFVLISELEKAVEDYVRIVKYLSSK